MPRGEPGDSENDDDGTEKVDADEMLERGESGAGGGTAECAFELDAEDRQSESEVSTRRGPEVRRWGGEGRCCVDEDTPDVSETAGGGRASARI